MEHDSRDLIQMVAEQTSIRNKKLELIRKNLGITETLVLPETTVQEQLELDLLESTQPNTLVINYLIQENRIADILVSKLFSIFNKPDRVDDVALGQLLLFAT